MKIIYSNSQENLLFFKDMLAKNFIQSSIILTSEGRFDLCVNNEDFELSEQLIKGVTAHDILLYNEFKGNAYWEDGEPLEILVAVVEYSNFEEKFKECPNLTANYIAGQKGKDGKTEIRLKISSIIDPYSYCLKVSIILDKSASSAHIFSIDDGIRKFIPSLIKQSRGVNIICGIDNENKDGVMRYICEQAFKAKGKPFDISLTIDYNILAEYQKDSNGSLPRRIVEELYKAISRICDAKQQESSDLNLLKNERRKLPEQITYHVFLENAPEDLGLVSNIIQQFPLDLDGTNFIFYTKPILDQRPINVTNPAIRIPIACWPKSFWLNPSKWEKIPEVLAHSDSIYDNLSGIRSFVSKLPDDRINILEGVNGENAEAIEQLPPFLSDNYVDIPLTINLNFLYEFKGWGDETGLTAYITKILYDKLISQFRAVIPRNMAQEACSKFTLESLLESLKRQGMRIRFHIVFTYGYDFGLTIFSVIKYFPHDLLSFNFYIDHLSIIDVQKFRGYINSNLAYYPPALWISGATDFIYLKEDDTGVVKALLKDNGIPFAQFYNNQTQEYEYMCSRTHLCSLGMLDWAKRHEATCGRNIQPIS